MNKLERAFEYEHNNPPAPFNPDYWSGAKECYAKTTASMEADGFYALHTREECALEWRKRYDSNKAEML